MTFLQDDEKNTQLLNMMREKQILLTTKRKQMQGEKRTKKTEAKQKSPD